MRLKTFVYVPTSWKFKFFCHQGRRAQYMILKELMSAGRTRPPQMKTGNN